MLSLKIDTIAVLLLFFDMILIMDSTKSGFADTDIIGLIKLID